MNLNGYYSSDVNLKGKFVDHLPLSNHIQKFAIFKKKRNKNKQYKMQTLKIKSEPVKRHSSRKLVWDDLDDE